MSFGPVMRVRIGEHLIELAPLTRETVGEFINPETGHGINRHSVSQYLKYNLSRTLEDEQSWYDRTIQKQDDVLWGIYIINDDGSRTLIGVSGLHHISTDHIRQATSGSIIFRKEYWGLGFASALHKARTWYAFKHLGLHRIMSAVLHGNHGSLKALTRSGYTKVYVERNTKFVNGRLHHQDNLECLNPLELFWSQWWGTDKPTAKSTQARQLTQAVLDWAEENVELL